MKAEDYFKEQYGSRHVDLVCELGDSVSLYGLMDEKMNILKNEQEGYNKQNPTIQRVEEGIDLLKRRLL